MTEQTETLKSDPYGAADMRLGNWLRAHRYELLLGLVLIVAACLRWTGLNWDAGQHLHPDERFLTVVETQMQPVKDLAAYFDTAHSTLNPVNVGNNTFVYGTLPMFLVRYLAQVTNQTSYDTVYLLGRCLSGLADLVTILMLYLIAARLFGKKVGLLAASFLAFTPMLIQQAHFFTVDTFSNAFLYLALYFGVRILLDDPDPGPETSGRESVLKSRLFWWSVAFDLFMGMAMASKINVVILAFFLPGALLIHERSTNTQWGSGLLRTTLFSLVGGGLALLTFRIFQPYAFQGAFGFFDFRISPTWWAQMQNLQSLTDGSENWPPALQWIGHSPLFSFQNMVLYGFGLPLGILAWAGFAWIGWRILCGQRRKLWLPWLATAIYFAIWSLSWNQSMRYQLPVYPLLAMTAAWFLVTLASLNWRGHGLKKLAIAAGAVVLGLTVIWGLTFTGIYTRPHTRVAASEWIYQHIPGPITLEINVGGSSIQQPLPVAQDFHVDSSAPYDFQFTADTTGYLTSVALPRVDAAASEYQQNLVLSICAAQNCPEGSVLARSVATPLSVGVQAASLPFLQLVTLQKGTVYFGQLSTNGGEFRLNRLILASESGWDDRLPLNVDGYDGFNGVYDGVSLELYDPDTAAKSDRLISDLDQADYLVISSNRQWGSLGRLPVNYPLTTAYYRALLGCPVDKEITWCYNVATPGQFQGSLGFQLVETFESFPTLHWAGNDLSINTQFAEESFTVYDAPKVLIFKKTDAYSSITVRNILGGVDLAGAVPIGAPRDANEKLPELSAQVQTTQQAGGTWSEMFRWTAIQNRDPGLAAVLWYLAAALLGLLVYPLLRPALRFLPDRGYPLARIAGLLLLAFLAWISGSLGLLPYTRAAIGFLAELIAVAGLFLAYRQRRELAAEFRANWRYYLVVEIVFLGLFGLDLMIRYFNPDLWHPWKGGERPMDFAYLNAVIKSTSFPAYDPWFAGGYLNYYYFGFVLVGTLIKLLGIAPSIAYNLALPTFFAMLGVGGFSLVNNLVGLARKQPDATNASPRLPIAAGFCGVAGLVLIGNLDTPRMVWQALISLGATGATAAGWVIKCQFAWAGFLRVLSGARLPIGVGDWYWVPSRVITDAGGTNPVTEFPLFTFLYGDLHAHLLAMPLTLLALSLALAFVFSKPNFRQPWIWIWLVWAGLAIGALQPTNTWDFPTYLAIGAAAVLYGFVRHGQTPRIFAAFTPWARKIAGAVLGVLLLVLTSLAFYQPYLASTSSAYTRLQIWTTSHTDLGSYLTQWGLFLFVLVAWLAWETYAWITSLSPETRVNLRSSSWLNILPIVLVLVVFGFLVSGIPVGALAVPLGLWTVALMFRPDLPDSKRVVLFLFGCAVFLTFLVEVVVVSGDVGRMNTVFKFYLQAWILFAVAAGAAVAWMAPQLKRVAVIVRVPGLVLFVLLLAAALSFSVMGSYDKMRDRFTDSAPKGLDGMVFLDSSVYDDNGVKIDLSQDAAAIRWLQDSVLGSPVIMEIQQDDYRLGSRIAMYTGLPDIAGWSWHERQQRVNTDAVDVDLRIREISDFYATTDIQAALSTLRKYRVGYIILGQYELAHTPAAGIAKFQTFAGMYWDEVFRDGQMVIYKVRS
jgi:Chlor_Arch_YYY domain